MERLLAIDPGKDGAIATLSNQLILASPVPIAGKEIDCVAIANLIKGFNPDIAIIEKVHSMPGQGVTSMFTFGTGYGMLLGIMAALQIRTELVSPQTWKKLVLAGTAKDKNAAIDYCRRIFPQVSLLATERSRKPHSGIADALCILEWGRRTMLNQPINDKEVPF